MHSDGESALRRVHILRPVVRPEIEGFCEAESHQSVSSCDAIPSTACAAACLMGMSEYLPLWWRSIRKYNTRRRPLWTEHSVSQLRSTSRHGTSHRRTKQQRSSASDVEFAHTFRTIRLPLACRVAWRSRCRRRALTTTSIWNAIRVRVRRGHWAQSSSMRRTFCARSSSTSWTTDCTNAGASVASGATSVRRFPSNSEKRLLVSSRCC